MTSTPENVGPSEPPPYSPPTGAAPYPPAAGMAAYPPPQQPAPPAGFSPAIYQTTPPPNDAIIRSTQHQTVTTTQVVVGGVPTCPQCRIGTLEETFTPLGICCAIFFFPIGLLFCMMMRRKICAHCGAIYM